MTLPSIRRLLFVPVVLFALFYLTGVVIFATGDRTVDAIEGRVAVPKAVAIFGASGTAGDGIFKAALDDPDIQKIHVITRRSTSRIEEGIALGKVQMTQHMDYLDYESIQEQVAEVDTVYWAIGISSVGADEETYGKIHVDFPMQFVRLWTRIHPKADLSFHFISSSDISEDSSVMWVREKIRAEKSLFSLGEASNLRVIAYRPDYIGPTREEANIGQQLLYWFFRPVGAAVKATEIGEAMIAVSARGPRIENGTTIGTSSIIGISKAHRRRSSGAGKE